MNWDIYELIRGPVMTGTCILFAAGLVFQVARFLLATSRSVSGSTRPDPSRLVGSRRFRQLRALPEKLRRARTRYANSIFAQTPFNTWLTVGFHAVIATAVFFTEGHNVLLDVSWGFRLPSIPEGFMDLLAVYVIVVSIYYLGRRAFSAKFKFPFIVKDYLAIILTAAPFVTGFMAYHQWFDDRTVIVAHMISGQLMILAMISTKLGHAIFFFFGRFFVHGELNLWGGSRVWKTERMLESLPRSAGGDQVDAPYIRSLLDQKRTQIKMMLQYCARCSNCAQSCFLYVNTGEASYIPSHKVFASLGRLYRSKGNVQQRDLENMVDTLWNKCVLCERCHCPVGIRIPELISLARSICRSQGVYKVYDH